MIINEENCQIGNKAMASVLLLYYHLLNEDGFTNDQTVYIDRDDFDGFSFLDASVDENQMILDIDEGLIREGAVIYLLCELNDMVGEFEEDYLSQEYTKKVVSSLTNRETKSIPEADSIVSMVIAGENTLNYPEYNARLEEIYKKYVYSRFKSFLL
ncbi:MAG: hypothetical protein AB2660_02630 [Candidatus Thiodiazotropha sp.]